MLWFLQILLLLGLSDELLLPFILSREADPELLGNNSPQMTFIRRIHDWNMELLFVPVVEALYPQRYTSDFMLY